MAATARRFQGGAPDSDSRDPCPKPSQESQDWSYERKKACRSLALRARITERRQSPSVRSQSTPAARPNRQGPGGFRSLLRRIQSMAWLTSQSIGCRLTRLGIDKDKGVTDQPRKENKQKESVELSIIGRRAVRKPPYPQTRNESEGPVRRLIPRLAADFSPSYIRCELVGRRPRLDMAYK